jgi:hypothetical protein
MSHEDVLEIGAPDAPAPTQRPSPWTATLVVMVCCVAVLTGATQSAEQPRLTFTAEEVLDAPQIAGDSVVTYVDGPDGAAAIAYDVDDGAVRWRYRPARRAALLAAGPVVMLAPASCRTVDGFVTEAVDVITGRPRWRQRGTPIWLVADAQMAVFKQPVRTCAEATDGFNPLPSNDFVWAGIDLADGSVRWARTVSAAASLAAGLSGNGEARWFAVAEDGTVTSYDVRTGMVVGTIHSPPGPVATGLTRVLGAGDQLLTVERDRGTLSLHAFGAPELIEIWHSVITAPHTGSRLELDTFTALWCGSVICLGPPTETVGLDPTIGAELWRLPGRPIRVGPRYALFVQVPLARGLALFTMYDLRTGQSKIALPDADLIGRRGDTVLVNTLGPAGDRLWRLDLETGLLAPVTTLPRHYEQCDAGGRYLACRATDGGMEVWRLPVSCPPACGAAPLAGGGVREGTWPMW